MYLITYLHVIVIVIEIFRSRVVAIVVCRKMAKLQLYFASNNFTEFEKMHKQN